MEHATALKVALQLLHMPAGVRMVRERPLPPGVFQLLQITARDQDALQRAATEVERDGETVMRAAHFFVEQVLWHPEADSFRVLGGTLNSSAAELKRNMALLMIWLHPDADLHDEHAVFVVRVTSAWNDLKTEERRAAYLAALTRRSEVDAERRRRRHARERTTRERAAALNHRPTLLRRMLSLILGPGRA